MFFFSFNVFATIIIMNWQGRGTELLSQLTPNPSDQTSPTHPIHTKDSHSTGITLLFSNRGWVLLRRTELSTSKKCKMGPPAYRPYPRRLQSLTICR